MIRYILAISTFKFLLLPSYRSTDFEVHRNWLAITYSLPLKQWYTDKTSQWTLDYPPLFAWFEWILAKIAVMFDDKMLQVSNLNYASENTILFQSLSVIVTDLLFAFAVKECVGEIKKKVGKRVDEVHLFLIIFANAGLILVDHIHFQYNGFLFGFLFLSIARILQKREIEGAIWFAVLLNLKHIYLYIAPAYFIYLLRSYCLSSYPTGRARVMSYSFGRLIKLSSAVGGVFFVSFAPFVYQLPQVLSRLFPFKRGLSHAYWAPNIWALYNFADKVTSVIGCKLKLLNVTSQGSMTAGLVQEFDHIVLPSIVPIVTFILTFVSMLPCLVHLWKSPHDPWQFVRATTICGFCSFLFGWHVHEKAILIVILPLSLLCLIKKEEAKILMFLSIVGHYSLFPLFFTLFETPIKVTCLLLHCVLTSDLLKSFWKGSSTKGSLLPLLNSMEMTYLLGLIPLFLYDQIGHWLLGLQVTLPFLPLMLTSVYCSIGVLYSWIKLYRSFLICPSTKERVKIK